MVVLFFVSSMLSGMSEQTYQESRQERSDRIFKVKQILAPKQAERSALEVKVNSAESSLRELQSVLTQEKNTYDRQCRKLHDDSVQYDPAAVPAQLAAAIADRVRAGNAVFKGTQQAHQSKKVAFDREMQTRAQKKELLLADIEQLQDTKRSQPEVLRKLQACIVLFAARNKQNASEETSLVQEAPPVYSELPSCVPEGTAFFQNDTGASTSCGTVSYKPSAPPAYDDVAEQEK
ncbi:hypothetical protein CVU75_00560 [Candidatus Dependentiae bacterium HGW-Dependentiae-1]|nr:MAG: hypothetical protein CVU75_00560 [Candidatus Dependentiae bacterium HGW-Dependentiae-1]